MGDVDEGGERGERGGTGGKPVLDGGEGGELAEQVGKGVWLERDEGGAERLARQRRVQCLRRL